MSDLAQARSDATRAERTAFSRDDARSAVLSAAAMLLAGAFVGYFLFTGMPALTFEVFPRTLTNHVIYACVALAYVIYLALARRLPGGSPLDLPVLGFIAAYALATVTSIDWRLSLEATLQLVVAVIVFYALADLPFLGATQLRRAAVLLAGGLSVYALWVVGHDYADYVRLVRDVERLDAGNIFPPTVPRVHGVSDHPNVLAMLLVLFLPFVAHGVMRPPAAGGRGANAAERIFSAATLAVSAMAIFLTLSRGGWLGVFTGVGFTVIGVWLTVRAYEREQQGFAPSWTNAVPRDISPTAIATLGGAAVLAVGGTLAFLSSSTTRPGWLFRGSLSPRQDAWEAGLDMFRDNSLLGAGPHTFGLLYPQYSGKFLVHTQHAHNGFLQLADDAGIVGLLALLGIALAVVYMLAQTWRTGTLDQRTLAVACAGALIGFSVHNQLDAGNIWKAPAIALALVGAIIVRVYRERPERDTAAAADGRWRIPAPVARYGPLAVRAALLVLIAVPFIGWYRIDRAEHDHWLGADAANHGRFSEAIPHLQDAVNADSSMMVYQLDLGRAQANFCRQLDPCEQALIDAAIVHLEQAVEIDPRSDIARANLARAYQLAGRTDDAAREAQITRLAANHITPVIAVAEVYEDMGRDADAIATYGQVLSMDASLADSRYWQMTEWRQQHYDEILDASIIGLNPCAEGALLAERLRRDPTADAGGLDDAEDGCKLLALDSPNDLVVRLSLAKILTAQGKDDEALEHLRFAVERQPDFGPARTELGRWYAEHGDETEAKRQWVRGAELDEPESVMLVGETYPEGQVPDALRDDLHDLLGSSTSSVRNDLISVLYYRVRYQRLSPVMAMIDGDWWQAVPRLYTEMEETLAQWEADAG